MLDEIINNTPTAEGTHDNCDYVGHFEYIGTMGQETGKPFDLYNCPRCHTTLSYGSIQRIDYEKGDL